ncbi:MAG: C1 family peptidase [Saprospiraceae bacterium]|nr:C1 family peptidase [Saprospiraceae bacterium]
MNPNISFLLLCILGLLPRYSQAQFRTGLVLDEANLAAVPIVEETTSGRKSGQALLQKKRKVDLKPYSPTVQHQLDIGSCVGWAVGYGALTIEKAIAQGWKGKQEWIDRQAYSALFIYNQIRQNDCQSGAGMLDALNLLKDKGNVLYKEFEQGESNCELLPDPEQLAQASQHKIKDFHRLFETNERDRIKINATKKRLIQQHPVVIAMEIKQNFTQIKRGDQYWWPSLGDTTYLGMHAMVVVGFDDGKQAFEIRNSWGDLWGNNGHIWVKYKDYARYCRYAFQLSLDETIAEIPFLSAQFELQVPKREGGRIVRDIIEPQLSKNKYKTPAPWPLYTRFQLVGRDITEGTYVYIFSMDAEDKLYLHWPRDQQFDHQFTGAPQQARWSAANASMYVPGINKALVLDKLGQQQLCMLLSPSPIAELNLKLKQVTAESGPLLERLQSAFQDKLISPKQLEYNANKMEVYHTLPQDKVLPIILEILVENPNPTQQ